MPTLLINRAASSTAGLYDKKILALGAGKKLPVEVEKALISFGYKNSKIIGVEDTKESDQELIDVLKEKEWDAISIG